MSGRQWSRQKKEIDAYNTFLSAYHSRGSYHGFSELGYAVTNQFPVVKDQYAGVTAEPDFLLHDDSTAILVEIKQGDNFNPEHVEQLERSNEVTIEKLEEFLDQSDVEGRFGFNGTVYDIETCIVYDGIDEAYIDNCRTEWEDCRAMLEQVEAEAPVLAQERGGRLRVVAGSFDQDHIQSWLSYGIKLPETPRVTVSMTDQLERESIAATICHVWGFRASEGPVSVTALEVRSEFKARELRTGQVNDAFDLLVDLGACEQIGDREYEFRPEHLDVVTDIDTYLSEAETDDDQMDFNDFG